MNKATIILEAYRQYLEVPQNIIAANLIVLYEATGKSKSDRTSPMLKVLLRVSGGSKEALHSWTSTKKDYKIPFFKLCNIASAFDMPIEYFYEEDTSWFTDEVREAIYHKTLEIIREMNEEEQV